MQLELIKKLSNAFGVAGFEQEVRSIMEEELRKHVDSLKTDKIGNLIATKEGGDKSVMIAAHLGEVGLSVKHIDKNGFLRFAKIGSIDDRILPSQSVLVKGKKIISGIIGSKPPHLLKDEEKKKPLKKENLFLDVGASSKKEVKKLGIEKGSPITFATKFESRNGIIQGKAFDDRLGCAALLELAKQDFKPTIYLVATTQEEVGLKGARVASYQLNPDHALVIDATPAKHPEVKSKECDIELGKGPVLELIEAGGKGAIISSQIRKLLEKAAQEEGIGYQLNVVEKGMTDAAIIQLTREGIPAGAVGIPARYIHQPKALASIEDFNECVKLFAGALKRI